MKQFEPDYYKSFSCIADKCGHSCCVGWEIDIDNDTFLKYEKIQGKLGEKLRRNLIKTENAVCFRMCENERCPFLNEKNLCEIILELGENYISQICTDHPRFYNEFSGREETGLGLCCEEAARIILSKQEKTRLLQTKGSFETEEENEFFLWREKLFDFVQNREIPFNERLRSLSDIKINREIVSLYQGLEILNDEWKERLNGISDNDDFYGFDIPFEQLLVYFIYRHTKDALYDGGYEERVAFSVLSVLLIRAIFEKSEKTFENLIDISRMYSSEIEYCEENTQKILEWLSCIL